MKNIMFVNLSALLILSSCSWYRNLERSMVDTEGEKSSKVVSKDQYDQLLVKYEELSKKYEVATGKRAKTMVEESSTETVDAFGMAMGESSTEPKVEVSSDLDSQIEIFRRAKALKGTNSKEAVSLFIQLEASAHPTLRARSKWYIAEMLREKEQFDLALQAYEDVIHKYANSGIVVDALKGAALCAERLGLNPKKEQYSSLITDVFEVKE